MSSNTKGSTVSKAGKIKTTGKGTCKTYVCAVNGVFKDSKRHNEINRLVKHIAITVMCFLSSEIAAMFQTVNGTHILDGLMIAFM